MDLVDLILITFVVGFALGELAAFLCAKYVARRYHITPKVEAK